MNEAVNKNPIVYEFEAILWQYEGPGGWFFVSLPPKLSVKIRSQFKTEERGWGRLNVSAEINFIRWDTSIWYDTKRETYLLPMKAEIRKKGYFKLNQKMKVCLFF